MWLSLIIGIIVTVIFSAIYAMSDAYKTQLNRCLLIPYPLPKGKRTVIRFLFITLIWALVCYAAKFNGPSILLVYFTILMSFYLPFDIIYNLTDDRKWDSLGSTSKSDVVLNSLFGDKDGLFAFTFELVLFVGSIILLVVNN